MDTTFNATGKVTTAIGSSDDMAYGVAIQADGKIVVTGDYWNGTNTDIALVRYNADGSLDTTFNATGIVTTAIGSSHDVAYSVAIQPDGKIVATGYSDNGGKLGFALVRYNTDGSLDTTFNATGIVTTAIGSSDDRACGVAIQPDGKIVAAGFSGNGTNYDIALVRYNIDGSLDTTFNATGKVTTAIGGSDDYAYGVAIQQDGKIVVTGDSHNGSNRDFALVRYNTDGSLDITFNATGKVTNAIGSSGDYANDVDIQSDGKIVVAGSYSNGTNDDIALVRYNADGSLDTTFNATGKVTTDLGSSYDYAYAVAIQPDGKIVVAGAYSNGTDYDIALVRYFP